METTQVGQAAAQPLVELEEDTQPLVELEEQYWDQIAGGLASWQGGYRIFWGQ
jgi:hypothetical protein